MATQAACTSGRLWRSKAEPQVDPKFTGHSRGAALLARGGRIFSGPEVPPFGEGAFAAEVVALFSARMAGMKAIRVLVLRGGARGTSDAGPPTAATLQILSEFAPKLRVFWGTHSRPQGGETVTQLLPGAFDRAHLSSA